MTNYNIDKQIQDWKECHTVYYHKLEQGRVLEKALGDKRYYEAMKKSIVDTINDFWQEDSKELETFYNIRKPIE